MVCPSLNGNELLGQLSGIQMQHVRCYSFLSDSRICAINVQPRRPYKHPSLFRSLNGVSQLWFGILEALWEEPLSIGPF
jgi:hypothetical protein